MCGAINYKIILQFTNKQFLSTRALGKVAKLFKFVPAASGTLVHTYFVYKKIRNVFIGTMGSKIDKKYYACLFIRFIFQRIHLLKRQLNFDLMSN